MNRDTFNTDDDVLIDAFVFVAMTKLLSAYTKYK